MGAAPGAQSESGVAASLWAKYLDFMLHLFTQHALVTFVVVLIGYPLISHSSFSLTSKLFVAVFSLVCAPVGIILGDKFRQFAAPDAFLASGMMDIFWKKLFFMYGPQIIGGVIGVFVACMPVYVVGKKLEKMFQSDTPAVTATQPTMDPAIAKLAQEDEKEQARLRAVREQVAASAAQSVDAEPAPPSEQAVNAKPAVQAATATPNAQVVAQPAPANDSDALPGAQNAMKAALDAMNAVWRSGSNEWRGTLLAHMKAWQAEQSNACISVATGLGQPKSPAFEVARLNCLIPRYRNKTVELQSALSVPLPTLADRYQVSANGTQ